MDESRQRCPKSLYRRSVTNYIKTFIEKKPTRQTTNLRVLQRERKTFLINFEILINIFSLNKNKLVRKNNEFE